MGRQLLTGAAVAALTACAMPGGQVPGAPAPDPLRTEHLNSGRPNGIDGFTQVVRIGPTVYVSGQVALDGDGNLVGAGDLRAQAGQAFENLSHALRIAGATPGEVARLTVYVVNLTPAAWASVREIGAQYFPQRNPPAGVAVGIAALPRDGLLIAVDAVAVVRADFRPKD
jgi:enamine deaminase RidA (YjgF/YER057c/UK114 family)